MEIVVSLPTSETVFVTYPGEYVAAVKKRLAEEMESESSLIDIEYAGNTLSDGELLLSSGIEAGDILMVGPSSKARALHALGLSHPTPEDFKNHLLSGGLNALLFVQAGLSINCQFDNNETPLFLLATLGNVQACRQLMSQPRIDLNQPNSNGETPLLTASIGGHIAIVKMLLENDEVLMDVNRSSIHGVTPLIAACVNNHFDVVTELIQSPFIDLNKNTVAGSALEHFITHFPNRIDVFLRHDNVDVNQVFTDGFTPLELACEIGSMYCVKEIITHPRFTGFDCVPLNVAAREGNLEIVKYLLAARRWSRKDVQPAQVLAEKWNHPEVAALIKNYANGWHVGTLVNFLRSIFLSE
eukprot:TRINITY_DN17531_c0_g1_i1.p1 TRINITY_DN17531_c0_g1~~TRINITY_DN17531_c0_g1_i1.p1  ORF type:complete len:374 (+),score=54.69 TRINITY_DN17531_c0_g1_i1:57-1124(+)